MGGSNRTRTTQTTNQTQNASSTMGSTPYALQVLPQLQGAAHNAADMGAYTGNVVAAPTQADRYTPVIPNVSGFVADPGGPLDDYTPDVNILDRYVAGATDTSRGGLQQSIDWANSQGGQVQGTAQNLGDYWNRVSSGEFLDPNTNTALQQYLATMSEGAEDVFARNAQQFESDAISSGAYGGTGYARGMAWGLDELTQNDLAQRAAVLYQNYGDEMARIEQSGAGAAGAFSLGMMPGQTLMGLGEAEQGYNQFDIDDQIARGSEIERGQALDIEDQERRRQDIWGRDQALLDNENALANWNIYQQQNQIQDDLMRRQVDQSIEQAGLTNAQSQHEASRWGEMDAWERYLGALANPAFGESSTGSMQGTSTTETRQQEAAWRQIMGGLSAAAQIGGMFMGGPAGAATGAAGAMGGSGGGGGTYQPPNPYNFAPIPVPQVDFSRYFSNYRPQPATGG